MVCSVIDCGSVVFCRGLCKKHYYREYCKNPEVKARIREYNKEYYKNPEVKAKRREYLKNPEVKAKRRERQREYYKNMNLLIKERTEFLKSLSPEELLKMLEVEK